MSLLEVRQLTKTYPRTSRAAVAEVSFDLPEGKVLALVGESGSGKTTLLRLLAGLETPDAGSISLAGKELSSSQRVIEPESRSVGLVFQHHALFPHLTIANNVGFGLRHLTSRDRDRKVQDLLALAGLSGLGKRHPHELSGGERQRVALIRSLATEPRLLLLDEPFSSLDTRLRQSVRDETRAILKARHATAVFVTHDTADALAIADHVVVLRHGVLQQSATANEIYHSPANAYVAAFFGPCSRVPLPTLPGCTAATGQMIQSLSDQDANSAFWARPEHLQLVDPNSNRSLLVGKVRQVAFAGPHLEVVLDCECDGTTFDLVLHHRDHFAVNPGEIWAIRWR